MLDFQPIRIDHKEAIQSYFDKNTYRNCDYSFCNLFSWQSYYKTVFAIEKDCLYIRFNSPEGDLPGYLFPLGNRDIKEMIATIRQDAQERNEAFRIHSVTRDMYESIEEAFPGEFLYTPHRDAFDYIYASESLISLVGKKYQQKRNHINKFKRSYEWEFLPITRDIIPDCLKLYERWCKENGGCASEDSLVGEWAGTRMIFDNYERLDIKGGALRINGEILAYSYGQALTGDTFGVHAEKSLHDIDGGYTMMNQQFAEHYCQEYRYINREEDLGYESLRQAKQSYHPEILLEKGILTEK